MLSPLFLAYPLLLFAIILSLLLVLSIFMFIKSYIFPTFGVLTALTNATAVAADANVTGGGVLGWYAPNASKVNDLEGVIGGSGVYGFGFGGEGGNSTQNDYYGGYNWFVSILRLLNNQLEFDAERKKRCNMPHVNVKTYPKADDEYKLEYVEVIHRHHKRTPYASNAFPRESYPWNCNDEGLAYYGFPFNPSGNTSASTYWNVYTDHTNPFAPQGFNGSCQFPQITRGGLDDSHQHGQDFFDVYRSLLYFLPEKLNTSITYRVTNNVITSQVASMLVEAMYHPFGLFPLHLQPPSIDSLEPTYSCPTATTLYSTYGVGSKNDNWTAHLTRSQPLLSTLDAISGVNPSDSAWHQSFDHYFDNLSSRLCHSKRLPCSITSPSKCITQEMANAVFRLGEYEYSYIYRDNPLSLPASVASFGVWIAELAQHIRDRISGASPVIYRHNVAHDGSLARLLSILQVDEMVWPGMGSEVVFEIFNKRRVEGRYVRILWGGQVLRSSNPTLGDVNMINLDTLLKYFDGLVGMKAALVPGLCGGG